MPLILWGAGAALGIIALILITSLVCFLMVFYSPKRKVLREDEYEIPKGDIYKVYQDDMIAWTKQIRSMPHEDLEVRSFDGLTLRGKYFEYEAGAPIELLFHGYKGNAERDLSGGVERCFKLGRNVILIDQRAAGKSDGHVISFGINERRDCHTWVKYAIERFGKDVKLIIGGVSMGAATVMMAAGEREFAAIAVVGGKDEQPRDYSWPCGVCRQVMMEFCNPKTFRVITAISEEEYSDKTLEEMLPHGFGPKSL